MASRRLQLVSPYEILFTLKPDYSLLKKFGCLCFVSTSKHDQSKLDPKVVSCVFLGYRASQKGYIHENHFPYHTSSTFTLTLLLHSHIHHPFLVACSTEPPDFSSYDDIDVFHLTHSSDNASSYDITASSNVNCYKVLTENPKRSSTVPYKHSHYSDYICNNATSHSLSVTV